MNVLTFIFHAKDDSTIENEVPKLIHGLIWIFQVGMISKLWTATDIIQMKNDDFWKLIGIKYTHYTYKSYNHK